MISCGILTDVPFENEFRFPPESTACIRPKGHDGKHLTKADDEHYYLFWKNKKCKCDPCRREDPNGWCHKSKQVTPAVAELFKGLRDRESRSLVKNTAT